MVGDPAGVPGAGAGSRVGAPWPPPFPEAEAVTPASGSLASPPRPSPAQDRPARAVPTGRNGGLAGTPAPHSPPSLHGAWVPQEGRVGCEGQGAFSRGWGRASWAEGGTREQACVCTSPSGLTETRPWAGVVERGLSRGPTQPLPRSPPAHLGSTKPGLGHRSAPTWPSPASRPLLLALDKNKSGPRASWHQGRPHPASGTGLEAWP